MGLGRSSNAAIAGLSESAVNADNMTEMLIVTANCWYRRPLMPGMKTVGMNTAARISASATTRAGHFVHGFHRRVLRIQAPLDMPFGRLNDDDCIIDNQADGEHEAEQRQGIDRKTKERENMKVPMSDTGTAINGMTEARQPCRW